MSASAVVSSPPLRFAARSSSATKQDTDKKHTALGNVLRVVDHDRKFVGARLRLAAEPFRPIHEKVSGILRDFFWLRFLEDSRARGYARQPSSWPKLTYPPGLSGLGILVADLEALMNYAGSIQHLFEVWTIPLPEIYDPEKVKDYFNCRPHVLMFRILEVLSSFSNAAVRLQLTRIFMLSGKDVNVNSSSVDAAYHVGQILRETLLNLGPTFIKVGQSLSTRPDIIGSEISKALSELQDKVPPFPRSTAMKIIEKELGGPVENYFSYISEEPIAAASFGQVYQGCTLDGCIVAIKVQRPNLLHSVVRDIYILRLGTKFEVGGPSRVDKGKAPMDAVAGSTSGRGLVQPRAYGLGHQEAKEQEDVVTGDPGGKLRLG